METLKPAGHRWSGWPGAWCLDCGVEDQVELAIADGVYDPVENTWYDEERETACATIMRSCPEPNSKRFDPYQREEQ